VCYAASWALYFVSQALGEPSGWRVCTCTFFEGLLDGVTNVLIALAPLPGDATLTRVALTSFLAIAGVSFVLSGVDLRQGIDGMVDDSCVRGPDAQLWRLDFLCWWSITEATWMLLVETAFASIIAVAFAPSRSVARAQKLMWTAVVVRMAMYMVDAAAAGALAMMLYGSFERWFVLPGYAVAFAIALRPSARRRAHGYLRRQFESCSREGAAAGVAALLGRRGTSEILDQARSRFRSVELAQLHEAELYSNVPDPALFQRSTPTPLGKCDAFISHSWHDDPDKKWQALQSWRVEFIAAGVSQQFG